MIYPTNPVVLRVLLRSYKATLRNQLLNDKARAHYKKLIASMELRLDNVCGDHDCALPECWRPIFGFE